MAWAAVAAKAPRLKQGHQSDYYPETTQTHVDRSCPYKPGQKPRRRVKPRDALLARSFSPSKGRARGGLVEAAFVASFSNQITSIFIRSMEEAGIALLDLKKRITSA
jgi:hypothetical protein